MSGSSPANFVAFEQFPAKLDQNCKSQFLQPPSKRLLEASPAQTVGGIGTKLYKQTQLKVLYMNIVVTDLRAARNCSSTLSSNFCIFCFLQTARATAGEPDNLEERGFHHSNRLDKLYNTKTSLSTSSHDFLAENNKNTVLIIKNSSPHANKLRHHHLATPQSLRVGCGFPKHPRGCPPIR